MSYNAGEYDVIVIGAGHAGCEAALPAERHRIYLRRCGVRGI